MLNHRIDFRQSSALPSVPDPLPGLSLEAAAEEEKFLQARDAAIAHCFGVSPAHMTQKRQTNKSSWDEMERRWLSEGPAILAATRRRRAAFEQARQQRLREDRAWEERLFRERNAPEEERDEPLGPVTRFGFLLSDFVCQDKFIGATLALIALYFAGGFLLHTATGQGACQSVGSFWQAGRTFLTGATP